MKMKRTYYKKAKQRMTSCANRLEALMDALDELSQELLSDESMEEDEKGREEQEQYIADCIYALEAAKEQIEDVITNY